MNVLQDNEVFKQIVTMWQEKEDFALYLSILSHQFNHVFRHSERVAMYSILLAKTIGCNDNEISHIGAAAMLHDIGKINVPVKVLYKQGGYNQYDRLEMERHSGYGYQMLLRSKDLRELSPVVLHHHEHYDGHGYPKGLEKEEIPLASRIIHIAEAFDVMTTIQNYQQVKTREQALLELERLSNRQFDASLVKAFMEANPQVVPQVRVEETYPSDQLALGQFLSAASIVQYMQNIANLGIICLDKNNTVVFCNHCAETMRQMVSGTLLGKNFLDSYPPHRRKTLEGKLVQLRDGEKNQWCRLMGRNGSFIENRYSRVVNEQGDFIGTVLVTIDVTERELFSRNLTAALERQAALYQAAQIITSALSIDEVIDGILNIIKKAIVVCRAEIHFTADTIRYKRSNESKPKTPYGQNYGHIAGKLRNTLRSVTIDDENNNLINWYVPIIYRSELLGILHVEKVSNCDESKERLEFLEALAGQTAVAIWNAKLHEEVAYYAEQKL